MLTPGDQYDIACTTLGSEMDLRPFVLCIPLVINCPICGYDEFTASGYDPACPECNGTGRITNWRIVRAEGHITYPDPLSMMQAGPAPGITVADVVTVVSAWLIGNINELQSSELGYAWIDGQTYRPNSYAPVGVGVINRYRVGWKKVTVETRAEGF